MAGVVVAWFAGGRFYRRRWRSAHALVERLAQREQEMQEHVAMIARGEAVGCVGGTGFGEEHSLVVVTDLDACSHRCPVCGGPLSLESGERSGMRRALYGG